MKDELGGQIMKEFVRLKARRYSYLKDNDDKKQKAEKSVSQKNFKIIKTVQKQLK